MLHRSCLKKQLTKYVFLYSRITNSFVYVRKMWSEVKSYRAFVLESKYSKTSVFICLLAMLHERQNVKWNLNCVFIGCDCHIQPWTSASARSLEAIGHLLKQLVCHLHFVTFQLATLLARDACRACRFYSTSMELSFCTHWVLLLQGVVSAGGVMRQWPAVRFRASTHSSCGVRSTTWTHRKNWELTLKRSLDLLQDYWRSLQKYRVRYLVW